LWFKDCIIRQLDRYAGISLAAGKAINARQFLSMLPDNAMYPALLGWGWGMGLMTLIPPPQKKKFTVKILKLR